MFNFYILLPKFDIKSNFKQFYINDNFISDLKKPINEILFSIYKVDINEYIKIIKEKYSQNKSIVTDWSNTFIYEKKDNGKLLVNEPVMKFMYNYIKNEYSFFICTIIAEKLLIEYAQNDIELYYKNKENYPLFPDYTNYIMCVGDRICKRIFMDKLQNYYDVKMLLDDNIYNMVKYYDPQLKININKIPTFALYINNENKNDVVPKIKFFIFIKIIGFKIKRSKNIKIYDMAKNYNYNISLILEELIKKKINLNKKKIFTKIDLYYNFMLHKNFVIKSNEDLIREIGDISKSELYRIKFIKYKKDYMKSKYEYGINNTHTIIQKKINNKTVPFNRASTILIEKNYINNENRNGPTIILFKDTKWKTFIEPGGRIDRKGNENKNFNDILIDTAIRELQEETLNTFNINKKIYQKSLYIDTFDKIRNKYGRTFFICIDENLFDEKIYYHNKNIIFNQKQNNESIVWRETNDVDRFYIKDIEKCLLNFKYEDVLCNDINKIQHNIYYNTATIIYDCLKKDILKKTLENPIKLKTYNQRNTKIKFLQNTITYKDQSD